MLKLNATLPEAIVVGEQQVSQSCDDQAQQPATPSYSQAAGTTSLSKLFKQMSHALYLWMD